MKINRFISHVGVVVFGVGKIESRTPYEKKLISNKR